MKKTNLLAIGFGSACAIGEKCLLDLARFGGVGKS